MKEKKTYKGQAEAEAALGKCYIHRGEIGEVIRIERPRGRDWYNVIYRSIYHYTSKFEAADGLLDMFAERAAHVYPAISFVREATEVPRELLEKAKDISRKAGEEIDKLINEA